jgi:UDP-N-acetylmuramoyl-L-alanyl-D-glutamate--2,6-diaminopimelate ligase
VRLHDLLDGLDVADRRGDSDVDVQSVVHDSRDARPGSLFCCIRGTTHDGHAYAPAAVAAGAVALLVEAFCPVDVPQVRVASVRAAVGPVAARFHDHPSRALRVLGVTGTNGKTTTTYLLESVIRAAGGRPGVIGTIETRIGDAARPPAHTTPEATELQAVFAEMRDAGVTGVAMEVSSHALEQRRVDGTRFAAACFTNLTHEHLDFHGSFDAYRSAKSRLFDLEFTAHAASNVDDDAGRRIADLARERGLDVATFGLDAHADVAAEHVRFRADGTDLELHDRALGLHAAVHTGLVGPFNVSNVLAAAATARLAGFGFDAVVSGLEAPIDVPGRMERVDAGQEFAVLVDYAHTPDALERVLFAARAMVAPGGKLVVVYGCGGDRDRAKRPIMGRVAAATADLAYLTSDNPRSEDPAAIAAEVLAGVPSGAATVVELDRRTAIRDALAVASSGDVVVIAGKGHETGQTAAGVTVPFDDRQIARAELEARLCS